MKTINKKMNGGFYIDTDVVEECVLDEVAILVRDIEGLPHPLPLSLDLDDYIFLNDLEYKEGRYRFPASLVLG